MFIDKEESLEAVKLPLQPQQLLGLNAGEPQKDSEINQAYDELMMAPVEPGYSQQTISGRAELLEIVRRDIITSKGKISDKREVNIPYDLVPGALALMAEVGQDEVVMYLGNSLLESGELEASAAIKHDVLLSMALSKCNMAREVFATGNQIATGCRHLEEALQLLQPKGPSDSPLAPELAHEINKSLKELRTQCTLEQVSLPIVRDQADTRKRAVRTIRELLKQSDVELSARGGAKRNADSGLAAVNQDFVSKLMQQLTCEEIVHLTEWESIARNPAPYKWVYPGLMERVAVGHIVTGFSQCQPAYVKMAINILKHVAVTPEVLVMQAVCQTLLGSVQASVDLLKQAEAMTSRPRGREPRDSSVMSSAWTNAPYSFLVDHTPAGDDGLLPGLCLYVEEWVARAAMPLFRDTVDTGRKVSLVKYFDDARVETLITVYDEKSDGITDSISSALSQIKSTVGKMGIGMASGKDTTVEGVPLLPERPMNNKAIMAGAAAAVVVGIAALSTVFGRPAAKVASGQAGAATASVKSSDSKAIKAVASTTSQLDMRTADQLIRTWQEAKQLALGPNYDTTALPTLLADPLLSEMRAKVSKFQQDGWFTRYKLQRVKVVDVAPGSSGTYVVSAVLEESASVVGADGQQAESYKSSYDAQYQVMQAKDGSWKVMRVVVQGSEQGK